MAARRICGDPRRPGGAGNRRPVKVPWSRPNRWRSAPSATPEDADKTGAKRVGAHRGGRSHDRRRYRADASVGEAVLFRTSVFACGLMWCRTSGWMPTRAFQNAISGAFRGYGSPQVAFASELQMDKLAEALGIDPLELRLKNALDLGDATITGDVLTREVGVGIKACLQAVRQALAALPSPEASEDEKIGVGWLLL